MQVQNSKPVVVKGNNSISSVNWYYMYQNSKLIGANSNVVSTMIWGSMWDRALIWLTETGDKTYSDLMNSSSWGNYSNSTGAAATNSGSKQLTGTNDAWQQIIYTTLQETYMIGRLKRATPAPEFVVAVTTTSLAPAVQRLSAASAVRPRPAAAMVAGQRYL